MSKQNISKGNPAARPSSGAGAKGAPNRTPVKSGGTLPPARNNANGNRPGTAAMAARAANGQTVGRAAQMPVKRKSGFRLRPLDIALLLAGALVVVFIVMSALQAPVAQVDANAQVPDTAVPVPIGNPAPDFNLPDTAGATHSLSSLQGKVVVLEFMATWCPHCQADAPMMNQLDAAYKDKGVQILGVNATPYGHLHEDSAHQSEPAKLDDVKWFKDNFSVTFPLLFDQQLKSAKDYGVLSYPFIYVVDKKGKIAMQPPETPPTYEMVSGAIDKLLK